MPMAIGSGAWLSTDAVSTVYTVSGLTFEPKALMIWTTGLHSATDLISQTANEALCMGFAASSTDRCAIGVLAIDASASANTQEIYRADAVLCYPTAAAAVDGLLDLQSFTSDGFTLIVDNQLSFSVTYFWMAWGGLGITNVATGAITEPGATGVASYTVGAGVQPTVVLFGGCQLTAAAPTVAAIDSGFMVGAATATGTGNQFVAVVNSNEGASVMETDTYVRCDECLAMITVGGGSLNTRASFDGFTATGFDLNWLARASTRRFIYLAMTMDAGTGVKVGNIALNMSSVGNTATVSGLTFRPEGALLFGTFRPEHAAGASAPEIAVLSIGAFTGTSTRFAQSMRDDPSYSDSELHLAISYDEVCEGAGNSGIAFGQVDLDAITADGFRLITDLDYLATPVFAYVAFRGGWTAPWLPPRGSLLRTR